MPVFEVVDAKPYHCGRMVRLLRREHRLLLEHRAVAIHRELAATFQHSCLRRAWLIDGELAALGGVLGSILSSRAYVWLAVSEKARRYPIAMCKEAERQLQALEDVYPEIHANVVPDDAAALRFAGFLGFTVNHCETVS